MALQKRLERRMIWRLCAAVVLAAICADGARTMRRCPNVPAGMLNAMNKMSRNTIKDEGDKVVYDLEKTPTHLFHNDTDVVRDVFCRFRFLLHLHSKTGGRSP